MADNHTNNTGGTQLSTANPPPGSWVVDEEVTFTGKIANRSADMLNWVIANYEWSTLDPIKGEGVNPDLTKDTSLRKIYGRIQYISLGILALFILAAAILMIVTRGQSLTIKKFAFRFVAVVALVFASFLIISGIYWVFDKIQGFFLYIGGDPIQAHHLLNISFGYNDFQGLKRAGSEYSESAFISLLLVKLTAITYYIMFGVLIIRKIILWFFIIVAPVFPLLILFSPLRNTAKIWIGEFFRWVLYGPLFAIFLYGLVICGKTG